MKETNFKKNEIKNFDLVLKKLYLLPRSLTGNGLRKTHKILSKFGYFKTFEIKSGKKVFDWTVPDEWKVNKAYIIGPDKKKILDYRDNPLYVINYSSSFNGFLSLKQLQENLYSIPNKPNATPYLTSYYKKRWGFCISHNKRKKLKEGKYKIVLDTNFFKGSMTISEKLFPGTSGKELLFSSYTCHPGMANDEICSPIALALFAKRISKNFKRKIGVRIVLFPETIGCIAYLNKRKEILKKNVVAGLTVSNIGHNYPLNYKMCKNNDYVNKITKNLLKDFFKRDFVYKKFSPFGSDERQYSSPGINLPIGAISRGKQYFKEYHTSLDKPNLINKKKIFETINFLENYCDNFEKFFFKKNKIKINKNLKKIKKNFLYKNVVENCEPFLTKYNLYNTLGEPKKLKKKYQAILWIMNLSDGSNNLLDISKKSNLNFKIIKKYAKECVKAGILKKIN